MGDNNNVENDDGNDNIDNAEENNDGGANENDEKKTLSVHVKDVCGKSVLLEVPADMTFGEIKKIYLQQTWQHPVHLMRIVYIAEEILDESTPRKMLPHEL